MKLLSKIFSRIEWTFDDFCEGIRYLAGKESVGIVHQITDHYHKLPVAHFPIDFLDGGSIADLDIRCEICGLDIPHEHYHSFKFDRMGTTEVEVSALCPGCRTLTTVLVRYYGAGITAFSTDGGITWLPHAPTFVD